MSELTITSCDGCGSIAPPEHDSLFPRRGWMSVLGLRSGGGAYVDCSSPECLELVAQQLIGKATDTDMPRRRVTATLPAAAVRELPGASVAATKTPRKRKPKVA